MYGTTQLFLEHFGLNSVKNLPGIEQLSRRDAERVKRKTDAGKRTSDAGPEGEGGITENGAMSGPSTGKIDDRQQTTDTGQEKTEDGRQTAKAEEDDDTDENEGDEEKQE